MKLVVRTDKIIKELYSRDIRNFIGSIVDEEFKDTVLWHKKVPPELIYVKPFRFGFEVLSWKNRMDLLYHLYEKIKDKSINIKGIKANIENSFFKEEGFNIPQKGLYFYYTRTPIILSVNPVEYKIVYACNMQKQQDDLIRYIKKRIKYSIIYNAKHYFDLDINLDDLNLIIERQDIRLVDYKNGGKKFQAVFLKIASNYSLPRFVGYKIGLGWGELIEKKF